MGDEVIAWDEEVDRESRIEGGIEDLFDRRSDGLMRLGCRNRNGV